MSHNFAFWMKKQLYTALSTPKLWRYFENIFGIHGIAITLRCPLTQILMGETEVTTPKLRRYFEVFSVLIAQLLLGIQLGYSWGEQRLLFGWGWVSGECTAPNFSSRLE